MTYPPPYNPALTLNSRRFLTLSQQPPSAEPVAIQLLATSHGPEQLESPESKPVHDQERPRTASSTFSNPASEHRTAEQGEGVVAAAAAAASDSAGGADSGSPDDATLVASGACTECSRENNTYLVEVVNYPTLQQARVPVAGPQ